MNLFSYELEGHGLRAFHLHPSRISRDVFP
jgi:hypothetical protein